MFARAAEVTAAAPQPEPRAGRPACRTPPSHRAGPAAAARPRRRPPPPRARPPPRGRRARAGGPAPQQPAADGGRPGAAAVHRHPITLDFQGADLRAVLRTFAEISGLNVVIDPAVKGTVDVALRDVPWDQALDIILQGQQARLHRGRHDRPHRAAARCSPTRKAQRRKLADAQALAGELRVLTRAAQLREGRRPRAAHHAQRAVAARRRAGRRAHEHPDHPRPRRSPDRRRRPDRRRSTGRSRRSRSRRASSRPRATSRGARRAVGLQRPGGPGARQHHRRSRSRTPAPSAAGRAGGAGARRHADRREPAASLGATSAVGLALGSINGAFNLDVALTRAREVRQGPPAVDAARVDAEQRRGRDHAGHADSDPDRVEQHRHGDLQGCGAHAQGDAANHGRRAP